MAIKQASSSSWGRGFKRSCWQTLYAIGSTTVAALLYIKICYTKMQLHFCMSVPSLRSPAAPLPHPWDFRRISIIPIHTQLSSSRLSTLACQFLSKHYTLHIMSHILFQDSQNVTCRFPDGNFISSCSTRIIFLFGRKPTHSRTIGAFCHSISHTHTHALLYLWHSCITTCTSSFNIYLTAIFHDNLGNPLPECLPSGF